MSKPVNQYILLKNEVGVAKNVGFSKTRCYKRTALEPSQKLIMETEDPIKDPKLLLENKCLENCREFVQKLSECEKRVNSRQGFTSESCVQELFDLTPCLDNCVPLSK
jgi:hypothetical protein